MLLVSPERLNNPGFRDEVLPRLAATCGLLVVDEAHCISDWGHDFRPDYRRIRTLLADLPDGIPVLATTATANARVTADVAEQLGRATCWCCAARSTASRCGSAWSGSRPPSSGWPGWPTTSPSCPARASSTASPSPPPRRSPTTCAPAATRRGVLRPDRDHRAARARGGPARRPGQGAGRHQRARHGLRRHARLRGQHRRARSPRWPTTSRSAAPAAAPTRPPWCCCPRSRTATSGPTSPRWPSRARSWCARPSRCSPTRAGR